MGREEGERGKGEGRGGNGGRREGIGREGGEGRGEKGREKGAATKYAWHLKRNGRTYEMTDIHSPGV